MERVTKIMEAYTYSWEWVVDKLTHSQEVKLGAIALLGTVATLLIAWAIMESVRHADLKGRSRWRHWERIKRMREKSAGELERALVADAITDAMDKLHLEGNISYRRKMYWFKRIGHTSGLPDLVPRPWPRKEHKAARKARLAQLKAALLEKHPDFKPKAKEDVTKPKHKLSLVRNKTAA